MKKGFTLVELLISISIIAIITIATAAIYTNSLRRARDAQRLADMAAIGTALESFYADHNRYPGFTFEGIPLTGSYIGNGCPIDTALRPYMDEVPRDPLMTTTGCDFNASENYAYAYDPVHNNVPPGGAVACGNTPTLPSVIAYGFRTAEILTNLTRDTCSGEHMGIDTFDYNKTELPSSN